MRRLNNYKDCLKKVNHDISAKQQQQITNIKKMMIIAEAVGMEQKDIWEIVNEFAHSPYLEPIYSDKEIQEFIYLCEKEELFKPFEPDM